MVYAKQVRLTDAR